MTPPPAHAMSSLPAARMPGYGKDCAPKVLLAACGFLGCLQPRQGQGRAGKAGAGRRRAPALPARRLRWLLQAACTALCRGHRRRRAIASAPPHPTPRLRARGGCGFHAGSRRYLAFLSTARPLVMAPTPFPTHDECCPVCIAAALCALMMCALKMRALMTLLPECCAPSPPPFPPGRLHVWGAADGRRGHWAGGVCAAEGGRGLEALTPCTVAVLSARAGALHTCVQLLVPGGSRWQWPGGSLEALLSCSRSAAFAHYQGQDCWVRWATARRLACNGLMAPEPSESRRVLHARMR